jgi:hypothetical protein
MQKVLRKSLAASSFSTAAPLLAVTILIAPFSSQNCLAQEEFEGWNLEPSVAQAHLVMVARVASISRVTMVEGAKTDLALREYRFQPVRRLKGIFQREQLSMTASDLGIRAEDASIPPPLKEGEFRLLILVQQQGNSMGCVAAAPGVTTFDQRVPLLTGPDDPLVATVETLIKVVDSRSRRERASLLIERLVNAEGPAAVPLLTSLRLRADQAALDERAYALLGRLAGIPQGAVRSSALEVLHDMLACRIMPKDSKQLDDVAKALLSVLKSDEANTRVRVTTLEALGHLLAMRHNVSGAREWLTTQLNGAMTYAERAAAATALSRSMDAPAARAVLDAFANLPLDELPARQTVYARAAVRIDSPGAQQALLARLKRSIAAGQSLEAEIDPLARARSKESLPILLAAAESPTVTDVDRQHIAAALGRLKDDRAVAMLIGWLRGDNYNLKEASLAALESIDSPLAAREARPLLRLEAHLPYKLRLARLLARHEMNDGYALATEHLADAAYTPAAALVLAALDDPRTSTDLSAILAARPDRRWQAAALTGLAAIGDAAARKQLLEILADDRNPLAADAAEAAGLTDDAKFLVPLAKLARSRNRQIALASLVALRRFLCGVRSAPQGLAAVDLAAAAESDDSKMRQPAADTPVQTRAEIVEAIAPLVVDTYVDAQVRQEALAVAGLLRGEGYDKLLSDLADQAELEGTPLLTEVQAELRRSRRPGS